MLEKQKPAQQTIDIESKRYRMGAEGLERTVKTLQEGLDHRMLFSVVAVGQLELATKILTVAISDACGILIAEQQRAFSPEWNADGSGNCLSLIQHAPKHIVVDCIRNAALLARVPPPSSNLWPELLSVFSAEAQDLKHFRRAADIERLLGNVELAEKFEKLGDQEGDIDYSYSNLKLALEGFYIAVKSEDLIPQKAREMIQREVAETVGRWIIR
jgi:hypothetical protein